MPESLFAASSVRLFGRLIDDDSLKVDPAKIAVNRSQSLGRLKSGGASKVARIHGFSFEGQYVDLARPAIFLVHDDGQKLSDPATPTGLAVNEPELLTDLSVWEYDREDFLLRIDVEVGPLERILLDAELGSGGQRVSYGGEQVRLRYGGEQVRLRYSGQQVRGRGGGSSD